MEHIIGGKDFFTHLEEDFWKNRSEFDYIIQSSPHKRDQVAIHKIPKKLMRKVLITCAKQEKKKDYLIHLAKI